MHYEEIYLTRAFELAKLGRFTTSPNPNVGCVIVRENKIVGEGYHVRAGEPHAEINALRMAGDLARGSTVYTTLEPCSHHGLTPPCSSALIIAGVSKVVAAMQDPNPKVAGLGFFCLKQAGIEVHYNILLQEAEAINQGFLKRMRTGFPWVRLKIATSIDGRTAMLSGESKWITSPESRQDVQRLRAESDVILSTASTILADNPSLTVRWSELPITTKSILSNKDLRQPIRVIIDGRGKVNNVHKVTKGGLTWIVNSKKNNIINSSSVQILTSSLLFALNDESYINLLELMNYLGKKQINSILVEAGPKLSGSLLNAGLVDEIILYQAPKLIGSSGRPLILLPELNKLSEAPILKLIDVYQIGPDLKIRLKPSTKVSLESTYN